MTRIWHQSFTDVTRLPSYARMLGEHARHVCGPQVELEVHGVAPGSYPDSMNPIEATRYPWSNHVLSSQIAHAAARAEREGFDAVVISCFFDPGLREARSLVDIPVVSMAETALTLTMTMGGRLGLIGLEQEQSFALAELAAAYGATDRVVATIPVEPAITEAELEGVYDGGGDLVERVEHAARQAISRGADLIIPAEGVLNTSLVRRGLTQVDGVPVIDGYGLGLVYAQALVRLREVGGFQVSHHGHYGRPAPAVAAHLAAASGQVLLDGAAWRDVAP